MNAKEFAGSVIQSFLPLFVAINVLGTLPVNRAFAKVASLFLAAISVALIRAGVVAMIKAP